MNHLNKLRESYTLEDLKQLKKKYGVWCLLLQFFGNFLFTPAIVQFGYNLIIPSMLNVREINYGEAFIVSLLINFLTKPKYTNRDNEDIIDEIYKTFNIVTTNVITLALIIIIHFITHIIINGGYII